MQKNGTKGQNWCTETVHADRARRLVPVPRDGTGGLAMRLHTRELERLEGVVCLHTRNLWRYREASLC